MQALVQSVFISLVDRLQQLKIPSYLYLHLYGGVCQHLDLSYTTPNVTNTRVVAMKHGTTFSSPI